MMRGFGEQLAADLRVQFPAQEIVVTAPQNPAFFKWSLQRVLWLGHCDPECVLARLPRDVLTYLIRRFLCGDRAYSWQRHAAWIGAAKFAARNSFTAWWSKEEYDESGPGIVHRKCF